MLYMIGTFNPMIPFVRNTSNKKLFNGIRLILILIVVNGSLVFIAGENAIWDRSVVVHEIDRFTRL